MEETRLIICIDFGHGDTVASYVDLNISNEPMPLNINLAQEKALKKISSVIYKVPIEGGYIYSLDSTQGKALAYFKGRIDENAKNDERQIAFGEFVKQVFDRIKTNNKEVFYVNGDENRPLRDFKLYIAAPTKWTYEEKQVYKEFIENALGHRIEWVINESDAAFYNHRPNDNVLIGNVLIIDYGSSTIDYTLMIDNRKAPIDDLANQLGASRIEDDILMKLQGQEEYDDIYYRTQDTLRELGNDYIDPIGLLKLVFRNSKETYYTDLRRDPYAEDKRTISCNVVYRVQPKEEYRNNNYNFRFEFDFTEDTRNYREKVEKDLIKLKNEIKPYLGNEQRLRKLILSGGASQMPWFEELCQQIFGDITDVIVRDVNNCSYVVSDGIAKYAVEQIQCLNELNDEMDRLRKEPNFYKNAYEEARKQAIIACIKGPLEDVCKEFAEAEEDRSVDMFINDIKECFANVIADNECQQTYRKIFQEIMMNEISVKVAGVLKTHFNVDRIESTDPVEFDGTLDVNRLSGFYDKLEDWFKDVYKEEDVKEIRYNEFRDDNLSIWGELKNLWNASWGLTVGRLRRKPMREVLAKKFQEYVLSGRADFSGKADSSMSEDDEEKTFWDQLESYAKKCAEQLFYRNELFDTRFRINNEHQ